VIKEIIQSTAAFCDMLNDHGVDVHLAGGETADVGDVVRSIDVGFTAFARAKKSDLIINDIKPGQVVVGLASYGQSSYEDAYNSGMGSNGLTSARHDVFSKTYAKQFPDSYDHNTPDEVIYTGTRSLTETIAIDGVDITLGKLVLSPTRTFLPVLKKILDECRPLIKGIIHNTGGAHTKVKKFAPGTRIIKDALLPIPPLFELIRKESGTSYEEMFQVFNMGTRLELYVDPSAAEQIIAISKSFEIDAQIIGRVEVAERAEVVVKHEGQEYSY